MLQALRSDAYDHYTAIYYLLLERLRLHRSSFPPESRIDPRKRRPSTIAEQALLGNSGYSPPSHSTTPDHVINSGIDSPQLMNIKRGMFHTTESASMNPNIHDQNVRNQFPLDMDIPTPPGITNCMQDYVPGASNKQLSPNQPLGQNVCNLGHMITTSIDEGVEADIMDSDDMSSVKGGACFNKESVNNSGLLPSCAFGDFSQLTQLSNSSLTGGSPFTSFDSTLDPDFSLSSLSVCSQQSNISGQNNLAPCSGYGANNITPEPSEVGQDVMAGDNCTSIDNNGGEECSQDRKQTRSPVNFREGRRASDGLVAQGIFAFRQRLQNGKRAPGMPELRQEHQHLQHLYSNCMTNTQVQQMQMQHSEYLEKSARQWSVEDQHHPKPRPPPLMKRMSLPSESFDIQPHRLLALKQSMKVESEIRDKVVSQEDMSHQGAAQSSQFNPAMFEYPTQNKPLQQQLLQHRLQQKRQTFQKQGQLGQIGKIDTKKLNIFYTGFDLIRYDWLYS